MKVRQHLQVSAEAFFAEIMTSICADIQKETKKKVSPLRKMIPHLQRK